MAASLETLYLFTADDMKSIVLLNTICGMTLTAAARGDLSITEVVIRSPLVYFWVWVNLLLFNVSNQRKPGAIWEDAKNKPWRPLPASRMKSSHTTYLLVVLHPASAVVSYYLGALYPCLAIQFLTFIYNDLELGDEWKMRNVVNAGGFLSFLAGALLVARGSREYEYSKQIIPWTFLLGAVIASTMHVQDLYDQEGDKLRGRRTIPLVFGDRNARRSLALAILAWSFLAPAFWKLHATRYIPSVALGLLIVSRLLGKTGRAVASDKRTYKVWSLWIVSLYLLPLPSRLFRARVPQQLT
ncbi:MAG: hypothetical protein LQ338_001198 [Usnochroma carphineum]|nr:MAG: hypothetical protein LQ338_001198 [Usnochroma carphineum]